MLNIYLCYGQKLGAKVIRDNDRYFNKNFYMQKEVDNTTRNLMYKIDKCKYTKNGFMITPDENGIDITNLSTGCKTAINIHAFPTVIFSTEEAGRNALGEIFKLPSGNIAINVLPILRGDNIINSYKVFGVWDTPHTFNNYDDMFTAVDRY